MISRNEKRVEYTRNAMHCPELMAEASWPAIRNAHREMAVEWMKRADAVSGRAAISTADAHQLPTSFMSLPLPAPGRAASRARNLIERCRIAPRTQRRPMCSAISVAIPVP
jgi:hypothetical protein